MTRLAVADAAQARADFDGAVDGRGVVVEIPLDKLKKSPRNARKTPHSLEAISALAASIAARTMIHFPVVEPETRADGSPTGRYLVTIGEGRRLAMRLLAERKVVAKTVPVRCVLMPGHDPLELSLDENVTRSDMHPADQVEAFRALSDEKGWSAEEIAARFGVSPQVVRQRLRLGAVSPRLMALYREEGLTLDQLMAFAVSEDHARQEQVLDALTWNRSPAAIRRAMTEDKIGADDRRAVFVGVEAYLEAGGRLMRDLFTEDGGGWIEDVALLERLVGEGLAARAADLKVREGWKWVEAHVDFPHAHGLPRVYPRPVERSAEDRAAMDALAAEYDALAETWAAAEDLPPEVEARLGQIDAALAAYGADSAYDPDDIARGGAFVALAHDGQVRVERGFIRPEDARRPAPGAGGDDADGVVRSDGGPAGDGCVPTGAVATAPEDDEEPEGQTALSDRLVADLTAHRTAALRDALAGDPDAALLALVHVLVLKTFFPLAGAASCLDVRLASAPLARHAEGIADGPVWRRIAERHETWARQMPADAGEVWAFVVGLDGDSRLSLMAHCASLTLDAVRHGERRPLAWAQADALAAMVGLDMATCWTPTVRSYLGRVTKARILEAVGEAVSQEAAERLAGMKKPQMAEAAQAALAGSGWLPELLRTTPIEVGAGPGLASEAG